MASSTESFLRRLYSEAVSAVSPSSLLRGLVTASDKSVIVNGVSYSTEKVRLVGFGKAVLPIAAELERILTPERISRGVLSVPVGSKVRFGNLLADDTRIEVFEGAVDNIPDAAAFEAAKAIEDVVSSDADNNSELVVVVISGGGSALLPYPRHPVTLQEKARLVKDLSRAGADIKELNVVRKKLSELKGGKLALKAVASGRQVVSLILSDVIGDPLDLIASGPTVLNEDGPGLARSIVDRYGVPVSSSIETVFSRSETKQSTHQFDTVQNVLVGNIDLALERMVAYSKSSGYDALLLSNCIQGEASDVAEAFAQLAKGLIHLEMALTRRALRALSVSDDVCQRLFAFAEASFQKGVPICVVTGGETVVTVKGEGRGGRNQELALAFALKAAAEIPSDAQNSSEICLLSAGTDGIDGPTEAAGAICGPSLARDAMEQNLEASRSLAENDSFTFFAKVNRGRNHVIVGHTGTNVMDVQTLVLRPDVVNPVKS